jgi:hypothetical protein
MMLTVIPLVLTLAAACPLVETYRSMGLTDVQIEAVARDHKVPAWVIAWARHHCRVR